MKPEQSKPFSLSVDPYLYLIPIRVSAKSTTSDADTFFVLIVRSGTLFFITTTLRISALLGVSGLLVLLEALQPVRIIMEMMQQ